MLNAFASLKCSKKCEHNVQRPNHGLICICIYVLGSITSRCSGNEPTLTPEKTNTLLPGGVRHDPQRVLGKNVKIAHLPLVTIE